MFHQLGEMNADYQPGVQFALGYMHGILGMLESEGLCHVDFFVDHVSAIAQQDEDAVAGPEETCKIFSFQVNFAGEREYKVSSTDAPWMSFAEKFSGARFPEDHKSFFDKFKHYLQAHPASLFSCTVEPALGAYGTLVLVTVVQIPKLDEPEPLGVQK